MTVGPVYTETEQLHYSHLRKPPEHSANDREQKIIINDDMKEMYILYSTAASTSNRTAATSSLEPKYYINVARIPTVC